MERSAPLERPRFVVAVPADPAVVPAICPPRLRGPANPEDVAAERVRHRLALICARCVRWYEGQERGLKTEAGDPACAAPGACGGLAQRMGYPHYLGPAEDGELERSCVVCGAAAVTVVRVTGEIARRGYCQIHHDDGLRRAQR